MGALFHPLHIALILVFASVLEARPIDHSSSSKRPNIRDIPAGEICKNTVSGLRLVADSQGYVCKRSGFDYASGCCSDGKRYSCEGCSPADKCCSDYEGCISCCLHPDNGAAAQATVTPRSLRNGIGGMWGDAFSYCSGVCRSHGRSTSHENSYIGKRHHCYAHLGRPLLSEPLPEGALENVKVVVSSAGQSCSEACEAPLGGGGKKCSGSHMALLNSCDRLRENVGCEAGCEAAGGGGISPQPGSPSAYSAMPSYVIPASPKDQRPAMCFTVTGANAKCSGKDANSKRLCACI